MNDLVSVIVPVYNAEKFIRETVNTVLQQSYENWELILVDDCSCDNSVNIIKGYVSHKIKLIESKQNSGPAITRNIGINSSKGRFIAFLDADDLWAKDKLQKQINFMVKNNYSFTFTGYEYASEDGVGIGKTVKVPKFLDYNRALKNTTIFTSTVILDKSKLPEELINMLNVKSEDTATWWKILKSDNIAYGLNEYLSIYRRSAKTLSSNKLVAIKRTWNLYRKIEGLSIVESTYNFIFYLSNAIRRRI